MRRARTKEQEREKARRRRARYAKLGLNSSGKPVERKYKNLQAAVFKSLHPVLCTCNFCLHARLMKKCPYKGMPLFKHAWIQAFMKLGREERLRVITRV